MSTITTQQTSSIPVLVQQGLQTPEHAAFVKSLESKRQAPS